jgi:hypothetical protein
MNGLPRPTKAKSVGLAMTVVLAMKATEKLQLNTVLSITHVKIMKLGFVGCKKQNPTYSTYE